MPPRRAFIPYRERLDFVRFLRRRGFGNIRELDDEAVNEMHDEYQGFIGYLYDRGFNIDELDDDEFHGELDAYADREEGVLVLRLLSWREERAVSRGGGEPRPRLADGHGGHSRGERRPGEAEGANRATSFRGDGGSCQAREEGRRAHDERLRPDIQSDGEQIHHSERLRRPRAESDAPRTPSPGPVHSRPPLPPRAGGHAP